MHGRLNYYIYPDKYKHFMIKMFILTQSVLFLSQMENQIEYLHLCEGKTMIILKSKVKIYWYFLQLMHVNQYM